MNMEERLHEPYLNVVLTEIVGPIDQLIRRASSTHVNSIVLGSHLRRSVSLTDLRGLGREIWAKEDAQRYIDNLRDEWKK